jgi:hypothetical protein
MISDTDLLDSLEPYLGNSKTSAVTSSRYIELRAGQTFREYLIERLERFKRADKEHQDLLERQRNGEDIHLFW